MACKQSHRQTRENRLFSARHHDGELNMAQGQNTALIGSIISNVVGALVRSPNVDVAPSQAPAVERVVEQAIKQDQVLVNQVNAEEPYQSRVTIGNVVALLGLAGTMFGWQIAPEDLAATSNGVSAVIAAGG